MRVYKLQLIGHNGPLVIRDIDLLLQEVKMIVEEDDDGAEIVITLAEMSQEGLDNLPEFGGY